VGKSNNQKKISENVRRIFRQTGDSLATSNGGIPCDEFSGCGILAQEAFRRMLYLERKRTERSGRRFVLMLLEIGKLLRGGPKEEIFGRILSALSDATRETDTKGWYTAGSVIGVIFTEIGTTDGNIANALLIKISTALGGALGIEHIREISLSFHIFPDDWENGGSGGAADARLYPDLMHDLDAKSARHLLKRFIDIAGSLLALIVCLPLFAVIAAVIKFTSNGPVLFRQTRLGQYGKKFTFLKFRSMHAASDHALHREFVEALISGRNGSRDQDGRNCVYKITDDPRITPVGKFLRRTSLDELPQFFNVLRGEMSLVGPRPPIPYEFQSYDLWHRCRLLAVKPGITGLWQVEGRSKVGFDEMVRLDLKYAMSWSVSMDLKILFKTPRAVLTGDGAY